MSNNHVEASMKRLVDHFIPEQGNCDCPWQPDSGQNPPTCRHTLTPDHRDEAERAFTDEDTPLATAHALFILADSIDKFTRELRLNTLTHHRATLPPGSPSAITAREHIETELGL